MLISCVVTTQLICTFDFAYAKIGFSHDTVHITKKLNTKTIQSGTPLVYISDQLIMPPTLKKLMGHIAFGACVSGCVGHTFCTYCNF